jgi:hypothetical protein
MEFSAYDDSRHWNGFAGPENGPVEYFHSDEGSCPRD